MDFRIDLEIPGENKIRSFREEVKAAVSSLDVRRAGRPVALCYTAGMDSDLIALELRERGIPFTPFFLDLWGINSRAFAENRRFLGLEAEVVRLERIQFYDEICLPVFRQFGIENPTYLALTYLFEKIPPEFFIVVGDGDFDRTGRVFAKIAEGHDLRPGGIHLPFSSAAVFNYLWAAKNGRAGEFSFFSSTPGLINSMIFHPEFSPAFPHSGTRGVLAKEYPELPPRGKTTNWDGAAYAENVWVREWLERHAGEWADFAFWRPSGGTVWTNPRL